MNGFVLENGATWVPVEGSSFFIGSHPSANGYSIADAATNTQLHVLPDEIQPLIAALQALPELPSSEEGC